MPFDDIKLYTIDGRFYPYSVSDFGFIELALIRDKFDFDTKSIYGEALSQTGLEYLLPKNESMV